MVTFSFYLTKQLSHIIRFESLCRNAEEFLQFKFINQLLM